MPDENQPGDATPQGPGYDQDAMGDVISKEQFDNSPEWSQKRLGKMAEKKRTAEAEAAEARSQVAEMRALMAQQQSQGATPPETPPEGLAKFKTEELRQVAQNIAGYQRAAFDPTGTDESRSAAQQQLSQLGKDPTSQILEIQEELSTRIVDQRLGAFEEKQGQMTHRQQVLNSVAATAFRLYGADSTDPNSELSQLASSKLGEFSKQFPGLDDSTGFVTLQAYQQASAELAASSGSNGSSRTGRGADPRQSAVLGVGNSHGGGSGADRERAAALKQRAQAGDMQAIKQVSSNRLGDWIRRNQENGVFSGDHRYTKPQAQRRPFG